MRRHFGISARQYEGLHATGKIMVEIPPFYVKQDQVSRPGFSELRGCGWVEAPQFRELRANERVFDYHRKESQRVLTDSPPQPSLSSPDESNISATSGDGNIAIPKITLAMGKNGVSDGGGG